MQNSAINTVFDPALKKLILIVELFDKIVKIIYISKKCIDETRLKSQISIFCKYFFVNNYKVFSDF